MDEEKCREKAIWLKFAESERERGRKSNRDLYVEELCIYYPITNRVVVV